MAFLRGLALAVFAIALAPVTALANGGHDSVGCSGCHSIHAAKGDLIFAVQPNKTAINPKTQKPYGGTTALCLGCHEESNKGGQGYAPVTASHSHPYGVVAVNSKVANVPQELLRGGSFECVSCHDPHPSNPNKSYLRVNVGAKGENIDAFCSVCHSVKADPSMVAAGRASMFSSMDQTRPIVPAAAKK